MLLSSSSQLHHAFSSLKLCWLSWLERPILISFYFFFAGQDYHGIKDEEEQPTRPVEPISPPAYDGPGAPPPIENSSNSVPNNSTLPNIITLTSLPGGTNEIAIIPTGRRRSSSCSVNDSPTRRGSLTAPLTGSESTAGTTFAEVHNNMTIEECDEDDSVRDELPLSVPSSAHGSRGQRSATSAASRGRHTGVVSSAHVQEHALNTIPHSPRSSGGITEVV